VQTTPPPASADRQRCVVDQDITGNLLADPLQELFGIGGHDKQYNPRPPVHRNIPPAQEALMRETQSDPPCSETDDSCLLDNSAINEVLGPANVPSDSNDVPEAHVDYQSQTSGHCSSPCPLDELYKAQNPDSGKACDKADPLSPPPLDVDLDAEVPTSPASSGDRHEEEPNEERGISPEECDKGEPAGFPEPVGAPPPLTAQQRARLHADYMPYFRRETRMEKYHVAWTITRGTLQSGRHIGVP
ncbi:unnamed protein product, partial [Symbiodinium sp. KB8]